MIRKLRRKFTAVMMGIVLVFVIGIFGSMYVFSKTTFENLSAATLASALDRFFLPSGAEGSGRERRRGPFGEERMPVSVTKVNGNGEAAVLQNQIFYFDDEEILEITRQLNEGNGMFGKVNGHSLRYIRSEPVNGEVGYAFVDVTMEEEALKTQAAASLGASVCTAALFFAVSLLLSRWMVKPVEKAWNDQRQFVADASHELKTPLTVVLSNTDMLIQGGAVRDDKNIRRLDNIKAEAQRMKGLIESLLTLARSDSGNETKVYSKVSISSIATYAILTMEPAIFDSGRSLESDIQEQLEVMGDSGKLRQLMDILLENALKYSDAGSAIQVRLMETGKRETALTVTSRGTPIPPEERRAIFRRFYRLDQSRGQESGYGLGLSIAQAIVAEHGGKIGVRSDDENSNTFFVLLPKA